jgi:hypothetical protein
MIFSLRCSGRRSLRRALRIGQRDPNDPSELRQSGVRAVGRGQQPLATSQKQRSSGGLGVFVVRNVNLHQGFCIGRRSHQGTLPDEWRLLSEIYA